MTFPARPRFAYEEELLSRLEARRAVEAVSNVLRVPAAGANFYAKIAGALYDVGRLSKAVIKHQLATVICDTRPISDDITVLIAPLAQRGSVAHPALDLQNVDSWEGLAMRFAATRRTLTGVLP